MPEHDFAAFVAACAAGRGKVWDIAKADARAYFGLLSEPDILAFIGNNGLEGARWLTTRPLNKNAALIVDAYEFYSGTKYGYIAFYYAPTTSLWIVKSLKRNTSRDPRVPADNLH